MKATSDRPQALDPHGTVDLELLIGGALVIDFPKRRACLLERADLPESFTREADWSTAGDTPRQTIFGTLMSMAKSWTGLSPTRVPVPMRSALF
jgi:hypothetical protein